jgi:maltooligosyltrehalose synthase
MKPRGPRSAHLCAFARKLRGRWAACIVPLRARALLRNGIPAFAPGAWESTFVRLPAKAPRRWRDALTGREIRSDGRGRIPAAALLGGFPVCLMESR